jgi:hypothetical protein
VILKQLRFIHVVVGLVAVAIFLATGVAMKLMFPAVYHSNEAIRYLYRANHVYILFAGLLNLAIGAYVSPSHASFRRITQLWGSVLLLPAPFVLVWAFRVEPIHATSYRPLTLAGVVLCLAGVGLHFLARPRQKPPSPGESTRRE